MERERFGSRLGFILISAGCAIGLGNVWRFPYITGEYGGAAFLVMYLVFLVVLGLPIMVMEFAVGRGSQRSIARAFNVLEPAGTHWHKYKWVGIAGCYLLMMFYTTVAGWMLAYVPKFASGQFVGADSQATSAVFDAMLASPVECVFWMVVVCVVSILICSLGVQKGVERITKAMMLALLAILGVLVVRALTLPGAADGVAFYLLPDFSKIFGSPDMFFEAAYAAMGQAFFTLSIGMGSMTDPYLPLEEQVCQTRRALELIARYGFGAALITKSARVLRDLELLKRINGQAKCVVQMTVTTYDEALCRKIEPNVSTTRERFEALKALRDAGIPTVVWLCPILPFLNDTPENVNGILDCCAEADVKGVVCFGMGVTLRTGSREYFYGQLDRRFPGLKEQYIRRYGGAYLLESPNGRELMQLFRRRCEEAGILHRHEQIFRYLRELETEPKGQLRLF